jgi:hypothetical protein
MFTKDIERVRGGQKLDTAQNLAKALGALSVVIGAFELAAPGLIARWLGMRAQQPLIRGYGGREFATGAGILATAGRLPAARGFVWARVAGDATDMATLAAGLRFSKRKVNIMIALGVVAAVTALDLVCALQMNQNVRQPKRPVRDYSARSGFPRGISPSFGIALREMREGLDWWDSWRRNLGRGGAEPLELEGRGREERRPPFELERREYGLPAGRA